MSHPVHEYPLTVLEQHLDTFGHVNNATYLQLLEEARWQWITEGGYGLSEIKERGLGPTILEISLKFRRELTNRQSIVIRSWLDSYVGKIAIIHQEIVQSDGEVNCEAEFVMGLFDVRLRK